jgi:D-alanine-D-alanine ligase
LYTNRLKVEFADAPYAICPAAIREDTADRLSRLAAAVFQVTGCTDIARVDFRLDEEADEEPTILEVNPLPGLNPRYSDLCLEAYADGMTYQDLITSIVAGASDRYKLGTAADRRTGYLSSASLA